MTTPVTGKLRTMREISVTITKMFFLLFCLYFFICSLSFLSDSFRILGGRNIGALFSNSELLKNPVVGVMIGVLVTVLVQSSSTSTSIIVGLVSAGAPVREAIPMIMGANIGTSVTNIIVALSQAGEREQFRRAFACANVHDMFNWLSAFILLIVEVMTGYLETVTGYLVEHMHAEPEAASPPAEAAPAAPTHPSEVKVSPQKSPDFLKSLTKPFTELIIQLDKSVLKGWATHDPAYQNSTTILRTGCNGGDGGDGDGGEVGVTCHYLFAHLGPEGAGVSEVIIGVILLAISLFMLCFCLIGMVKVLNSLLGPKVKNVIENVINADIPIRGLAWLTGYLAMLLGAIMTILVQSSSVFTSTLTPLAGAGLVSLERAYPMTLGSNLGTTTTSLLASFAAGGHHVREANQIALVHLLFNFTGILIFYPVPVMRLPVRIARVLGQTTAQYRWFAAVYLAFMFFIFPSTMFLLSLAGPVPLYTVLLLATILFIFILTVNLLQSRNRDCLPHVLRSWDFLPLFLRSLEPWDRLVVSCCRFCSCCNKEMEALLPEVVPQSNFTDDAPFPSVAYNRLHVVPSSASFSDINFVELGTGGKRKGEKEKVNRRRYQSTSIF